MKMYNLVDTEGDAATDAALNDLGLWSESRSSRVCGDCRSSFASPTFDDGLCGGCREANDAVLLAHGNRTEAERLVQRVTDLFPTMSAGQVFAMAANIMKSQS